MSDRPGMRADGVYLHWSDAGGPNECEHGYAEGISCPRCDANPKMQALERERDEARAEAKLAEDMARDAHNDWLIEHAEVERLQAKVERLRQIERLARFVATNHDSVVGMVPGIYALRAVLDRANEMGGDRE